MRSSAALWLLLVGCPSVTDRSPYRAAALTDDDSSDDDSADDDDTAPPCDVSWVPKRADPVSFTAEVEPFFVARCQPCHTVQGLGELNLGIGAAYGQLVGVPNTQGWGDIDRVTPGQPEASYLIHKVVRCDPEDATWGHFFTTMPPPVAGDPLSDEDVGLLWSWVAQGATDQ